jgi:hypothetical protein
MMGQAMQISSHTPDPVTTAALAVLWSCSSVEAASVDALRICAVDLCTRGLLQARSAEPGSRAHTELPRWLAGPLAARRPPAESSSGRAAKGSLVPRPLIGQVILRTLHVLGGAAEKQFVDQVVLALLGPHFTFVDLREVPSGGVRWEIGVRAAREDLVVERLLVYGTPYGKWKLTPAGHARARQLVEESRAR